MNIDYKRARFQAQLTDSCVISTPAGYTSDGKGGRIPGTPTTATEPCMLIQLRGQLDRGDLQVARGFYRLRLRWAAVVNVGDTIILLGHSYIVRWTPPAQTLAYSRLIGLDEAAP